MGCPFDTSSHPSHREPFKSLLPTALLPDGGAIDQCLFRLGIRMPPLIIISLILKLNIDINIDMTMQCVQ